MTSAPSGQLSECARSLSGRWVDLARARTGRLASSGGPAAAMVAPVASLWHRRRPGRCPQRGMASSGKATETSSMPMLSTTEVSECRSWASAGSAVSRWSAGRRWGVATG